MGFSDRKRQWDEQHDAHFHEQRDTANQPHHSTMITSAESQRSGSVSPDAFRRAGNLHHFAEDGAKTITAARNRAYRLFAFYRRDHLQRLHAHHRADKENWRAVTP